MPRSLKKGPFIDLRLVEKMKKVQFPEKEVVQTWSRAATITPEMISYTFGVHNGREFIPVKIREDMVGHKLGEFSPTTKFVRHGGKIQRGLEQEKKAK